MKLRVFSIFFMMLQGLNFACDVPVFRYALERWERDLYRVFVIHDGELSEESSALYESLNIASVTQAGYANFIVYDVDLNVDKTRKAFYKNFPDSKEMDLQRPQLMIRFPSKNSFYKGVVWQGEFNQKNVDEILNSKATAELMQGVLQGYSSTFLLMESGDDFKDKKALATITQAIAKFETEIDLPKGVVQTDGEVTGGELTPQQAARRDPSNVLKSGIPLKIDFHLVRMPKNNENDIFRSILSKTHDSSNTVDEPKIFAFFGRGRLLGPMVGDDISLENLTMLAEYLCGACSCQMKRQNPGLDFLTNLDWMSYLEGSEVVVDKILPPLIGVLDIAKPIQQNLEGKKPLVVQKEVRESAEKPNLSKNLSVTLGLIFAFIIGGTLIIRKK